LGGRLRIWAVLGVLSLVFTCVGTAWAQGPARTQQGAGGESRAGSARMPVLEERTEEQDASLQDRIEEITAVGDELERAQARADGARDRVGELGQQTRRLQEQIDEQEALFRESQERYRDRARAAYKGDSLEGFAALLDGWLGSGDGFVADPGISRVLLESRHSMVEYEESGQALRNTRRQISQKKNGYKHAISDQQAASAELHRREQSLDEAIHRLGASKARTKARLHELEAAEKARLLRSRAATGVEAKDRGHEIDLVQDRIVATDVDSISRKRYTELYKASARKYGFGADWYILAAVGKVESDHGENMGPSSAGAMGPMQFLPSTWEASGVDGDGDGVANIMDPEDAIPAAAGYLEDGGAPHDWYRALYSYNHADWYVKKVLAVAEGYRRLAKDDKVGPYI
jgi:peptidoglycan hydrolase CwlO-like protein